MQAAHISAHLACSLLDISFDSFEGEGFAKIVFHIRRITVVACCRWIHLLEGKVGGWAYNSAWSLCTPPGNGNRPQLSRIIILISNISHYRLCTELQGTTVVHPLLVNTDCKDQTRLPFQGVRTKQGVE